MTRLLLLAGCCFLVVMALTHVAERLQLLPSMGWGLPDSPGHYLDLISAIAGMALLVMAGVAWLGRSFGFVRRRGWRRTRAVRR